MAQTQSTSGGIHRPDTEVEPSDETAPEPRHNELTLDVVFDILRNERRRLVLESLEDQGGSTTLSDLAEHIGAIENGKSPTALNAQERKRVYVGLYQCHLPKMDDAGAIEFEKNRGTVELGPYAETYYQYLERETDEPPDWPVYYGAVAGVSLVALVGVAMLFSGAVPFVALIALLAVATLAGYHWHARHP